jgi:hypothetical protein
VRGSLGRDKLFARRSAQPLANALQPAIPATDQLSKIDPIIAE